jgi:hypothetical protein
VSETFGVCEGDDDFDSETDTEKEADLLITGEAEAVADTSADSE